MLKRKWNRFLAVGMAATVAFAGVPLGGVTVDAKEQTEAIKSYANETLSESATKLKERLSEIGEAHPYGDGTMPAALTQAMENAQGLVSKDSKDEAANAAALSELNTEYANWAKLGYGTIPGTAAGRLFDTNGNRIQAHGGQIQQLTVDGVTKYYWIGEDKTYGYRPCPGIHMYSSEDLYNWKDEGVVLRTMTDYDQFETDEYFRSLYGSLSDEEKKLVYADLAQGKVNEQNPKDESGLYTVIERPKMLYNDKTGKYVIWFHADGQTPYDTESAGNYAKAKAGVAIADKPTGPFRFLGSYMLAHADFDSHGFDSVGGHVRDMNLFKDDNGDAYVLYSSEGNAIMYIAKLNDSYTGLVKDPELMIQGEDFAISSTDSREAPAMVKYEGKYYLMTSGCTGWAPNQARYAVADSPLGPWKNMGDPCVGDSTNLTFSTQSTCIFPVGDPADGKYIYMGDRWYNPDKGYDLKDSRYVWLPVEFGVNNTMMLKDYKCWTKDELGKNTKVLTTIPETASSISDLLADLPKTLKVVYKGETYDSTPVDWSVEDTKMNLDPYAVGTIDVTGKLTALDGAMFTLPVTIIPSSLQYLIDCNTKEGETESDMFKLVSSKAELLNKKSDQPYSEADGWGYTSSLTADIGDKANGGDFYNCGWWARSNKSIDYSMKLSPGTYVIATGYQEWWNTKRNMKVTVTSEDTNGVKTTIGGTNFTLGSSDSALQINTEIVVPEDSVKVNVSVGKTSGSDAVVSWIAAMASVEEDEEDVIKSAQTFYIDAVNGDDANDGLSEAKAWKSFANVAKLRLQAGGKLLLKAGCTWNDEKLELIRAKGTKENPVILGSYGSGAKPVINGNGNAWLAEGQKNVKKQDAGVVHVLNSQYVTVENLEVTNWEKDASDLKGDKTKYDQSKYLLSGIVVENRNGATLPGVTIRNNYVHDVNGFMKAGADKGAGGIIALVTGDALASRFADLSITGNEVYNVCHEAIYMESSWAARSIVGGADSQDAGKNPWVGWPNVYVGHNYVHDVAGDGIVLINAAGGTAEYNLVDHSASEEWTFSGRNPAHAAIWMWDCDNVTMQYNEAAHTESTQDGMAFDSDYGNQNILYQYNYSHDNKGGFYMSCPGPYYNANVVVRYNLSVNDGGSFDGARSIRVGESGGIGNQIYNNTIYWDQDFDMAVVQQGSWGTPLSGGTEIYNNIFCGNSDTPVTMTDNDGISYDSNAYYGSAAQAAPGEDANAVSASSPFDSAKVTYTTGTFKDGKVTLGTVEGLVPDKDAATVDKGANFLPVPQESKDAIENELVQTHITLPQKDYAGNATPHINANGSARVDIGAYECQSEGNLEEVKDVDKTWLDSLIGLGEGYKEADFAKDTWGDFKKALKAAKTVKDNDYATQPDTDRAAAALESAIRGLKKLGGKVINTPDKAENVVEKRNEGSEYDNVSFEKEKHNWGLWQASREISDAQAHTGSYSLKVNQSSAGTTGYSELGSIEVKPNTEYLGEAWIYCGDDETGSVGMEVKHHANVTGSGDIKLVQNVRPDTASDNGWHKVSFEFTTQGYGSVSIAVGTDVSQIFLDDVIVYEKYTIGEVKAPVYTALDAAVAQKTEAESAYTKESWQDYEKALETAKLARIDAAASQADVDQAAKELQAAFAALKKTASGDKPGNGDKPAPAVAKPQAVGSLFNTAAGTFVVTKSDNTAAEAAFKLASDKDAKKVTIPAGITVGGITYKVTAIADNAFKGNKKLTSVTIPSSVVSIGKNAFSGCTALKKITIPAGVTTIGANAFKGDKNLKKITIKSTVLKKVGKGAFKGIHKKATIKVPKKQKKIYQKLLKKKGQASTVKIK
ncbi:MAG: hypothetical protein E7294_07505 [Lachnospiraceae bacterium]|jgi:hypothetical protein|nr:hypothetical protein [Lachnospiraceae bacterium]